MKKQNQKAVILIVLHFVVFRIQSEEEMCSKLPDFVDYDAYDAEVFKCAHTKPRPQTVIPGCNPYVTSRECRKAGDSEMAEQFVNNANLGSKGSILKSMSSGLLIKKKRHNVRLTTIAIAESHSLFIPVLNKSEQP